MNRELPHHYRILDRIGGGGMGVVYKASDTRLDRLVAVKFLQSRLVGDEDAKRRFLQEARAAAAIDHPNICTIYEIGETPDRELFLVMAYYEGETVAQRIHAIGPLSLQEVVDLARQLLIGLARAHEAGIVHRDIKPGNLMITRHGELKILDFGLAKLVGRSDLSVEGMIQGTAAYMAPEQIQGLGSDHRADIWASGVVLYEMLAGHSAFQGGSPATILHAVVSEEPPSLFSLRPELPPGLEKILEIALAKDPAARYQTAREFLAELEGPPASFSSPPTLAMPVPGKPTPPRSILVLPFVSVSPENSMEYFVDGLTDEVITDLSGVEALRVISRTSAMQLKGSNKSLPTIARELHVQFVLEGTVRIYGKSLRINAKLVDAARDINVWAEKLSGTLEDVLELEEELSRKIVQALKVRLTPGEEQRLSQRPIRDPRAYEFYLRARQEILQYSEEALDRALRYLDEATRITGENVQLLAARGYAYWQYLNAGVSGDRALLDRARECAERILALEPESPHGQRLLGLISITEGDLQQVVRYLKSSLAHDPNDSDSLAWLLAAYALAGHPAAATPIAERLLRIDPLTPLYQCLPGHLAVMAGDFPRALPSFEKGFRMEPNHPFVRFKYAQALALAGRAEEALEVLAPLCDGADESLFGRLARFYAQGLAGKGDEAPAAMNEEGLAAAQGDMEFSWILAECYALAGETNEAIDWLANAVERGFLNYPLLAQHDPLLAPVRGDPRCRRLLEDLRSRWEAFEP